MAAHRPQFPIVSLLCIAVPREKKLTRVSVSYGFFGSNLGDVAVTMGAVALIKHFVPDANIKIISPPLTERSRPSWRRFKKELDDVNRHTFDHRLLTFALDTPPCEDFIDEMLKPGPIRDQLARSAGVHDADMVVYSGGEHLFSYGGAREDWSLLGRLLPVLLAPDSAICLSMPTTFGPFESPVSKELIARVSRRISAPIARDKRSLAAFPGHIDLGLDPAFFLSYGKVTSEPELARAITNANPTKDGPVALVTRRQHAGLRAGPNKTKALRAKVADGQGAQQFDFKYSASLIEKINESGRETKVLVQCDADYEMAALLGKRFKDIHIEQPKTLPEYITALSNCSGCISSRFHSVIFSAITRVPTVGFYYKNHGHKMPGLLEALDRPDLAFDAETTAPDIVVAALSTAISEGPLPVSSAQNHTMELLTRAFGGGQQAVEKPPTS